MSTATQRPRKLRKPARNDKIAAMPRPRRKRVLILWNDTEEDVYETWREAGPRPKEWNPDEMVPDVGTVAEEMDRLVAAVREAGHEVTCINIMDQMDRVLGGLWAHDPHCVFNLVEWYGDDEPQEHNIAGLYELAGVPFTGAQSVCLVTCQNKYRAKLIIEAAGLPTSPFFLVPVGVNAPEDHELSFPVIVKPVKEDASGGISHLSVVHDQEQLRARVAHVHEDCAMAALCEEYIEGREIHAALLGNDPVEVLPLFEMEFDDSEFNPEGDWKPQIISFEAKWDPHTKDFYSMDAVVPPEDLDEETAEKIRDIARRAYKELGCRDYARIDMRVDEEGNPYILEVNPNPDLADGAAYMMCAAASGRTYNETIAEVVGFALRRAALWSGELEPVVTDQVSVDSTMSAPADETEPTPIDSAGEESPEGQAVKKDLAAEQDEAIEGDAEDEENWDEKTNAD